MSRSARLLSLLQALRRHRHPVTARDLSNELGVSVRTIYRDIQALVDQGARIEGEAGIGFVLRPGFLLPPLMFSDEELEAIVLGARWVAHQPDDALARAAHDAVTRITAVLPARLQQQVTATALYAVPRASAAQDAVDTGSLRQALRDERKVRLTYRDEQHRETARIVWPLALAFHEQVRMLVAWCEMRGAFRHFRTDRIVALDMLPDALPRPRLALLDEWRKEQGIPEQGF